jgi:hypothetical protein
VPTPPLGPSVQDARAGVTASEPRVHPGLLDGVTLSRPLEAIQTVIDNAAADLTGHQDRRVGPAVSQLLLGGQQFVVAGLRALAKGRGVVAEGSSLLSKVLPTLGIASGAWEVWKGWNELQSHSQGPLSIIHSREGRTGLMDIAASSLMFVPGVGTALGAAILRLGASANEMDMFHKLDWAQVPIEARGSKDARIAHPLDSTPTTGAADDPQVSAQLAAAKARDAEDDSADPDPLGRALVWVRQQL